jgi:pimeloyl-ACP methyl ester carboxylesterase
MRGMPRATVGQIELEYDSFGDPTSTPLLLVMGLSYQMIEWDERLCRQLAGRGFWVTRFDNRDVGLSTKLDDLGAPDLLGLLGGTASAPYSLDDMAADAVGLLDALGVERAHIVGVSMGGMIAQLIAINHPQRVLSLTSIMSTTGGPDVVQADPEITAALLRPPGTTREERIETSLEMRQLINGKGLPFDEAENRRRAAAAVDRCYHPDGFARQLAAILVAPDRSPALSQLTIPALVIHGEDDPLVPPENGRRTAKALADARLMMIPAMGHNVPEREWPAVIDAIVEVTGRAAAPV